MVRARSQGRAGLDEETVLQAGAALVDAEGWEALSLARLAEILGVRTPSLYNHVAGLEGLRRGLALRGLGVLRDRMARAAIGKSGAEALLSIASAYRGVAKEHPGLYVAGLRAPAADDAPRNQVAADILLIIHTVLAPYALTEPEEIHAIRAFRSMAHGFVSLELAGGFGMPFDLEESYQTLVDLLITGLEQRTRPHLSLPESRDQGR
jgi:AcrR family transcriptional regulator